ncbi:MAG: hypothetical protein IJT28_04525 [Bacteroidaceae bacterium]|nr:hypothetical protein [Bacteroidaceae bacterium]
MEEDYRKGCPKAIKCDKDIKLYSGNLTISTHGQGGEGIESKETLHAYKATVVADTFDDCFNTGACCYIDGAHIYCLSHNNDGIDSNGCIIVTDGIVASVNESKPNESFDSEDGQFHLLGGTVFGIGSGPVDVMESVHPCYTMPYNENEGVRSQGFILTENKYISILKGNEVVMTLQNDNKAFRSFITFTSPSFTNNETLTISEGDYPSGIQKSLFDGRPTFGGFPCNSRQIADIQVQTIQ